MSKEASAKGSSAETPSAKVISAPASSGLAASPVENRRIGVQADHNGFGLCLFAASASVPVPHPRSKTLTRTHAGPFEELPLESALAGRQTDQRVVEAGEDAEAESGDVLGAGHQEGTGVTFSALIPRQALGCSAPGSSSDRRLPVLGYRRPGRADLQEQQRRRPWPHVDEPQWR